ncbi:MAG: hydrogenase expression/formation protein HypE [Planctomycetota bacterium]
MSAPPQQPPGQPGGQPREVPYEGLSCPLPHLPHGEVLLGHGSGGRLTQRLLEELFLPAFANEALAARDDAAVLELPGGERLAFSADAFVVSPLFFPGGDLGELAVNGTVNDLACVGARPRWLSAAFILEEGFPLADLARLVSSMQRAARAAGVELVTGDTKVVQRGKGDGCFVSTSGVGLIPAGRRLTSGSCQQGDVVLVSGTLGDHGLAVLAARERLGLEGELASDTAPLHELAEALLAAAPSARCLRDPTRGGLAAALQEIGARSGLAAEVEEAALPLSPGARGALELLGLDPLLVANEGKLCAVVPEAEAEAALAAWRGHPLGARAARVGRLVAGTPGRLVVVSALGGRRTLELPLTDPLPRIC